jgi:hypothetical protein
MVIAAISQSLALDKLPIGWFDAALLVTLGFGAFRGRKNGMTKEIIPLFQWIALVLAPGFGYPFVAQYYHTTCHFSILLSDLIGYLTIAAVVFLIFSGIKKALTPRLAGSNIFGSGEYYLAVPCGIIRYFCIVMFILAFINAKHYTRAEIEAKAAYNARWYGGGIYTGNYIPDLHTVQDGIFKKSFTGPYIAQYLGVLLIQTVPGDSGGDGSAPPQKQPVIHIGS